MTNAKLGLCVAFLACSACELSPGEPAAETSFGITTTTSYTTDESVFPNPERGFHTIYTLQNDRSFPNNAARGDTLVHSYIHLDSYRGQNLPQSELDRVAAGFSAVRSAGLKVIPRFAYNFGPWPNCNPDASEFWIKTHIGQLASLLAANRDVIAWIEAGFIGCWGEWHTSSNGLEGDAGAKQRIIAEMFARWPDRPIQIRYPLDQRMLRNYSGFSAAQKNRLGFHHDCLFASEPDDWGTWGRNGAFSVQQDKDFVASSAASAPNGGETCNVSTRSHCSTALTELAAQHFSNLNGDFNSDVINIFKNEGCYDTIKKKLGYRLSLVSASYSSSDVGGGRPFTLKATIANTGFGRVYNKRPLFAVLDGGAGTFAVELPVDVRAWGPGETHTIDQVLTLPANVPAGNYRLSLWLPDEATGLRGNPRYSVRFANQNTWDGAKGYNVLSSSIAVGQAASGGSGGSSGSGGSGGSAGSSGCAVFDGSGSGLKGDYFRGTAFSTPALSRIDARVDFDWGNGEPVSGLGADDFSVRWTGQVAPRYSGAYTFYTQSDDGVRLWVNGSLLVDNWTEHAPTENSGSISLVAGQKYDIKLEYYERGYGALARLSWSSSCQAKGIIPSAQLYPGSTPPSSTPPTSTPPPSVTNLIQNPGFESGGLGPWSSWGGMSVVNSNAASGSWAAQFTSATGGGQVISVSPNTSYKLSAWGKVSGSEWGAVGYKLMNSANSSLVGDQYMTPFSNGYAERSLPLTTTANTSKLEVIVWHSSGGGAMYVDDVRLSTM